MIIFLGGGVNGLSTAYQLAKRGKKTLLIEKVFFAFLDVVVIVLILNHILILSWKDKNYKMKKIDFLVSPSSFSWQLSWPVQRNPQGLS